MTVVKQLHPKTRQLHNLKLALALASANIAIHAVLNKAPLFKRYQHLDVALTDIERQEAIDDFKSDHAGRTPIHVGSTKDPKVIRNVWQRFPDALPAICGGPNGLIILDVDFDPAKGKDGPKKLADWLADNNYQLPHSPVTVTQSGGEHIYLRDDGSLGNHEGLFSQLDVNVRGNAGYVVAPGSIREDGRIYSEKPHTPSLMTAFAMKEIPDVPEFVVRAIKASVARSQNVSDTDIGRIRQQLEQATLPDFDSLTDELDGEFDLRSLSSRNPQVKSVLDYDEALDDGGWDFSASRMTLANALAHEYGDKLTPEALCSIMDNTPGCGSFTDKATGKLEKGEFNARNVARDYLRAVGKEQEEEARAARLANLWTPVTETDYGVDAPANDNKKDVKAEHSKKAGDFIAKLLAKPLPSINLEDIEDIPFVLPNIAARGYATAAVGPGGASKSQYLLQLGLAKVTGRPEIAGLSTDEPLERGSVWFHNQEDDEAMNQRRIAAVCATYGVKREEIDGSHGFAFYFTSGADNPILVAARSKAGDIRRSELVKPMIENIKAKDICLLMMDPMSELHTAKENANEEIAVPWRTVRYIAQQANCAAIIAAHTRKPDKAGADGYAGVIDAMRGGSAQAGVIRSSFTVYTLSEDEAKEFGIPEADRRSYACVMGAKSNLSPIEGKMLGVFKRTSTVASKTGKSTVGVLVKTEVKTAEDKGRQGNTSEKTIRLAEQQQMIFDHLKELLATAETGKVHIQAVLDAINADRVASAGGKEPDLMLINSLRTQLERMSKRQIIEKDKGWNICLPASKWATADEDDEMG